MKQYLMGLFVLALCCSVVELLAPAGEGGGISRHIKLMSALCLLCALITPLSSILGNDALWSGAWEDLLSQWTDQSEQAEQQWQDRWSEESEQLDLAYAQQTVAEMLRERFALEASCVKVTLIVDANTDMVSEAVVALSGKGIWLDSHAVQSYIESTFGWQSTIYIE